MTYPATHGDDNMTASPDTSLKIVVFQEDDTCVAQCLNYDISAEGDTPDDAIAAFRRLVISHSVVAHEKQRALFEGIEPAPFEFWNRWDTAPTTGGQTRLLDMPGVTIRKRQLTYTGDDPSFRQEPVHGECRIAL